MGREDIQHPWLFDRCREVQAAPDGYLDLWSREHYKSTIITFGKTIQDILASHGEDPLRDEVTVGIFSHTRPIAKGFLRQIKREFESNDQLKNLFPDILWREPGRQSPKWSEDDGIVLIRKGNPKESTVEAWGLVDSQPTSKHFNIRVYDDVVTRESVGTPEMIHKTTDSWELSLNLGTRGGIERYIGTRYHFNDTYREMMARGAVVPRVYPATDSGKIEGEPVLLTAEELEEKRRKMGAYNFACQMMQNPIAGSRQNFKREWLRFWQKQPKPGNRAILVDPANEKKKKSDYTAAFVVDKGADGNLYVIDIVRDRLSLSERTDMVFGLHRKWKISNKRLPVYYERYGKDTDIDHIRHVMEEESYRFDIHEVGGQMAKNDRIDRLEPDFEAGEIWLPERLHYTTVAGEARDMVKDFIDDEYLVHPVAVHDDMFDCLARIKDIDLKTPSVDDGRDYYEAWR